MLSPAVLLSAAVSSRPMPQTRRTRLRVAHALAVVVGVLGFVTGCWVVALALLYGWQTGVWDRVFDAAFLPFVSLLLLFWSALAALLADRQEADARRVWDAVLDHVEGTAATRRTLEGTETLDEMRAFHLIGVTQWRELMGTREMWILLWPTQFVLALILLPDALGLPHNARLVGVPISTLDIVFAVLLALPTFAMLLLGFDSAEKLTVTATEQGITWHRGKRAEQMRVHRASWDTVRAFLTLEYKDWSQLERRRAYLLDTSAGVLGWVVPRTYTGADTYTGAKELEQLVRARLGYPPRDITTLVAGISKARGNITPLRALGLSGQLAQQIATRRRAAKHRALLAIPWLCVMILVFGGPLVASNRLQAYQQRYVASLPARILAEQALYAVPSPGSAAGWRVAMATAETAQNCGLVENAATSTTNAASEPITGGAAFAPETFGDVAVSVTAGPTGLDVAGNLAPVGLALRAATLDDLIVFAISPGDGSWWLTRSHCVLGSPTVNWLAGGSSTAIRQGDVATNHMLAVMRASELLLYVNGSLVGSYPTSSFDAEHLPSPGRVGVLLSDGTAISSYAGFAVYPVKSPPSLAYV